MKGSAISEYGCNELRADQAVQRSPMHQIFIQRLFPLKHDDGPGVRPGQREYAPGKLHQIKPRSVRLMAKQVSQKAEAIERLTYFRLKDHNYQDEQDCAELLEYPAGHEQIEILGHKVKDHQKPDADHDLQRLRVLEPAVQLVDKKAHDQYVCDILWTEIREQPTPGISMLFFRAALFRGDLAVSGKR